MNLIPFALKNDTNELVDVADVKSGKACDCYCPSCKIPLIAKKGEVKEWHFSHDPAYDEANIDTCDFSWLTAVKLMIKQLLIHEPTLSLPSYSIGGKTITKGKTLTFDSIENGVSAVDLVAYAGQHKLGITFGSCRGQSAGFSGIVRIEPEAFELQTHLKGESFKYYLANHLKTTTLGKSWLFHQNEKKLIEREPRTKTSLMPEPATVAKQHVPLIGTNAHEYRHRNHLACRQCDTRYVPAQRTVEPSCPHCKSRFHRFVLAE